MNGVIDATECQAHTSIHHCLQSALPPLCSPPLHYSVDSPHSRVHSELLGHRQGLQQNQVTCRAGQAGQAGEIGGRPLGGDSDMFSTASLLQDEYGPFERRKY